MPCTPGMTHVPFCQSALRVYVFEKHARWQGSGSVSEAVTSSALRELTSTLAVGTVAAPFYVPYTAGMGQG